jgi:hypothetical protein
MSTTVYQHLRTFCAQYLNDFGEEFFLINQEINTLTFLNHLKQFYSNESVIDLIESKKQSIDYWNKIFSSTPLITTFNCRDIVPNVKQQSQTINSTKRIAYMQVTFDWINTIMDREDKDDRRWLLTTEGRHLIGEQPLFSSQGMV